MTVRHSIIPRIGRNVRTRCIYGEEKVYGIPSTILGVTISKNGSRLVYDRSISTVQKTFHAMASVPDVRDGVGI